DALEDFGLRGEQAVKGGAGQLARIPGVIGSDLRIADTGGGQCWKRKQEQREAAHSGDCIRPPHSARLVTTSSTFCSRAVNSAPSSRSIHRYRRPTSTSTISESGSEIGTPLTTSSWSSSSSNPYGATIGMMATGRSSIISICIRIGVALTLAGWSDPAASAI